MSTRTLLITAGIVGGLGVVMGAFGAHYLEPLLNSLAVSPDQFAKRREWLETAVRYQMFHAAAFLAFAALANSPITQSLVWPPRLILAGVAIFSGLLLVMTFTGIKILGAIVPIGGVLMIAGWLALLFAKPTIQQ